jgi:hypothetical protein
MQVKKQSTGIAGYFWMCFFILIGIGTTSNAADINTALWSKANEFYSQKKYDSAAANYEVLLKTNSSNAMLQYNTGNAYYRMNKMGMAILHFEKAAHLNPNNREIKDNLQIAKSKVQDNMTEANPIFFVAWWNNLNRAISANVWAVLALLMFAVVLTLIYFARTKKENFANAGRWVSLGFVCLLICGSMAWISYNDFAHPDTAVVINGGGSFLQSPQANAKVIGSLPEGLVLKVLDKQGAYIKVNLQNGKIGWVAADVIGEV